MTHIGWPARILVFLVAIAVAALVWQKSRAEADPAVPTERRQLVKLMEDGNFNDAFIGFRARLLDPDTNPREVGDDLRDAISCLQRLNRAKESDELLEKAIATHQNNWRLLWSAARLYQNIQHFGHRISGEFERGQHRGGGEVVNSLDRDRVRSLQLYLAAMRQAEKESADVKREASGMLQEFAGALLLGRGGARQTWRLQYLTDLEQVPDYEEGWWYGGETQGAPVDAEGNPIFYDVPASWDASASDGERWRWLWQQAVQWNPTLWHAELNARAGLLHEQFGVQTLADYGLLFGRMGDDKSAKSRYALHTLTENETIAKLANGVKRFDLPHEHNFIKLYQQVLDRAARESEHGVAANAAQSLASIFENRRQYPRAAEYWRQVQEFALNDELRTHAKEQLAQIEGNWGQFESVMTQPAGKGATVEFRFRNGKQVEFTAHQIDVAKLLSDVKAYIKSKPERLEWERLNVDQIGYRLMQQKQREYIGKEVAKWSLDLEPREAHFDRRITVTTPLQKSGAYLVTAKMADGNTSQIVLWLADTAIVQKQLEGQALYYVADAVTGQPIAKANVELFGYKQEHVDGNRFRIDTQQFAENTDADGVAVVASGEKEQRDRYQWLAIATTPAAGDKAGRMAYLGFHGVWNGQRPDPKYNEVKAFAITDRPVYRPGQKVHFKFWIRHAQYDQQDVSEFAHQTFQVEIHNPRNEKVYTQQLTANAYGGIEGELELPADATLGQYQLLVVNRGGGTFRVEEYKKPEFEVLIEAPEKPVMLGEKFTAKVEARYYFGEPVKQATVKYKVTRTPRSTQWYPPSRWDWLYGPGYWWFSSDYDWYPGWQTWGCPRPAYSWIWQPPATPEIVAQGEGPIGDSGTLKIEIDTALAKELHGDTDHSYRIEAEVTDQSRRTIVGTGEVLAARKPFDVFVWVDRGYFRTGDTITVSGAARTPDGKPVIGAGKLKLLRVTYNAENPTEPIETEVKNWDMPTTAEGRAELQLKASEAGQYRLDYEVTDKAGHTVEGGYLFTIVGEGFDGSDFQFSDLELIPDKRHYAPGEKVKLQINTNRVGSSVLLFVRPVSGVYPKPQVVRLRGKSTIVEIDVVERDMPNFFVEAATVANGRYHSVQREIAVPPATRVLNVEALPSADAYQPGQEATVKIKLTDDAGKAVVGETVITIYDKSVEYISGGSNVPDIRKFFWEWKRSHHPQNVSNLVRVEGNLVPPGETAMQFVGVFGYEVIETKQSQSSRSDSGRVGGGQMRGMKLGVDMADGAPAAPAEMAMAKSADAFAPAGNEAGSPAMAAATVRTEFADTALWNGSLETNSDGIAEVKLKMPENLTTWKIRVWAMGQGTRVGEAAAETVTRKNLLVRLQMPRFLVETDEVVLSANVHNYLPEAKQVRVRLELDGNSLEAPSTLESTIEVAAGGEQRVDWRVKAVREGEAVVRAFALTDVESDAMELKFPVLVHGMEKMDSYSGVVAPDAASGKFVVTVPEKRRSEETRLEVRFSPTLAGAMIEALPYMIEYPYGCTEQTLNRFLPAVVTQRTLQRLGVDLKALQENRNNLNPQELGDPTKRAEQWKRFDANPVFSTDKLNVVVKASVRRLTDMQLSDGGWGWFSGWGEHSTPHMTATVVRGLLVAKANDVAIVPEVLQRGVEWLQRYQAREITKLVNVDSEGNVRDKDKPAKRFADNIDALVYHVLVEADVSNDKMRDYLYRDRTKLAVYGLAVFGLALEREGQPEKLAMVVRNIGQYLVLDDENQTAYLNLPAGFWWYWYGSEYEAQAYYLKLLVATDPQGDIAPRLVKYLLNNRKHATYWNSTRDTALVVEAMADYLAATGEAKPDMTVEVWVDGQRRKEAKITPENLFTFDNALAIEGDALAAGEHTIELRKQGGGRLYWNGYLSYFTLEDNIKATGLELRVNRKYYKLVPVDSTEKVAGSRGQVLDQRVEKFERQAVPSLAAVTSGDLVEVEFTVESKNDYEYILIVDPKAAGFEPVDVRSGYTGNALDAYVEYRDETVNLFVRALARGNHSAAYRLRAEIPGQFSALPTVAQGMYAPELKGNSDEWKVRVEDRGAE